MRILDEKRKNYTRKFSDSHACVFCEKEDDLDCLILNGKYWKVRVNKFPYMDGNVLIIPLRHIEETLHVSEEEWKDFGETLSRTQNVLKTIFDVNSFNIGMNLGPESGASIAHLHWQVVPRKFKNITVMNTFADLHVISMTPQETKEKIEEFFREKNLYT